jgi:hypothetical protein
MTLAVAGQGRNCLQAGQLSAFERRLSISQWIVWSILRNFLSFRFHFLHFPLLLFFHVIISPLYPLFRVCLFPIPVKLIPCRGDSPPPPKSICVQLFRKLLSLSLSLSLCLSCKAKVHRRVYKSLLLSSLVYYLNPIRKLNQLALN